MTASPSQETRPSTSAPFNNSNNASTNRHCRLEAVVVAAEAVLISKARNAAVVGAVVDSLGQWLANRTPWIPRECIPLGLPSDSRNSRPLCR